MFEIDEKTTIDDEDLFYFESDHLALRGNKDYSELLKTIFILESQRSRAIKDYETVAQIHSKALEDPSDFVTKLKCNEDLGIPDLQVIAEVPIVNWSKYDVQVPNSGLKLLNDSSNKSKKAEDIVKYKSKADTHNKPWTNEEQTKLEELLVKFPPEAVELRRFRKIAAALGNRTVKQVTSRVQKYFLKLYKAGQPIPGRIPKSAKRAAKSKLHLHQRYNHYLWKPTTFFPELDVPVTMTESVDIPGPSHDSKKAFENSSNYLLNQNEEECYKQTSAESLQDHLDLQLELLLRVKQEKQREQQIETNYRHINFKCTYCDEEPIEGTRWHCEACNQTSIDFCTDCVIAQMYSDNCHPLNHILIPIRSGKMTWSSEGDNSTEDESDEKPGTSHDFDENQDAIEETKDMLSDADIKQEYNNFDCTKSDTENDS